MDICSIIKSFGGAGIINGEVGLGYSLGDEDFYREILQTFFADYIDNKKKLQQFYADKNYDEYLILTHGIKNTARTIGADAFSDRSKEQEMAVRNKEFGYIDETFSSYIKAYDELAGLIERVLAL